MTILKFIKEKDLRALFICLLAFFLPLSKFLAPLMILLLGIEWVINQRWKYGFWNPTYLIFFSLFFVYQLFSLAWSDNWDYGGADITAKLSLILMPLLLGTRDENLNFNKVFEWFIYGTLILFVLNFTYGTIKYFETGEESSWFYSNTSFLFHVSYASLYSILAIPLLYYLYVNQYKFFSNIWLVSAFVGIESIHVVLLNSKASFIALMAVYLVLFLYFLRTRWFKPFILPAILVLTVSLGTLFSFDFLYTRFFGGFEIFKDKSERTISNDFNNKKKEKGAEAPVVSSQVRVIAWTNAWEIIRMKPFGVGIGDRKDVFLERVGNKGHKRFVDKGLNTHNQYLQVLLAIGIPGFVIFLLNLFYPICEAWRMSDFVLVAFTTNVAINIMFESMLEVQAGIIFYAFFAVLLTKQLMENKFTFPKQ